MGVRRLLLSAFLTDASLYLAFAALPFRAIELGAGPARLGILPTLYAVAYIVSASTGGRISDRVSRLALARGGSVLFSAGCVALAAAGSTPLLLGAIPVLGIALGFFWSPLQAALADRTDPRSLSRSIAAFNVAWSLGKGAGLLLGGVITEAFGAQAALMAAAFPLLANLMLLSRADSARRVADPLPSAPVPRRFLAAAWLANALAFGTVGTLNVHAPPLLLERGAGPAAFGVFLGAVFMVQTLAFAALRGVRPSRGTILAAHALALTGAALFLSLSGTGARLAAALPLGLAFGLAYHASLHVSLDREDGRGRAAGLHESLLGAGSSSLPLAGGLLAAGTGELAAPFLLAAALLALGLVGTATGLRNGVARRL